MFIKKVTGLATPELEEQVLFTEGEAVLERVVNTEN